MGTATETDASVTESKRKSTVVSDRLMEKLLSRTKFLRPLLDELMRYARPYMWLLVGLYLSLIVPMIVLMCLLFHVHGYMANHSTATK